MAEIILSLKILVSSEIFAAFVIADITEIVSAPDSMTWQQLSLLSPPIAMIGRLLFSLIFVIPAGPIPSLELSTCLESVENTAPTPR